MCGKFLADLFLSTPSARRATVIYSFDEVGGYISIHALREEGDFDDLVGLRVHRGGFLSTPSARRATQGQVMPCFVFKYFYPRPPRGGRRRVRSCRALLLNISIHALREEGDHTTRLYCSDIHISIHALREEGDVTLPADLPESDLFLSTPSARRAT